MRLQRLIMHAQAGAERGFVLCGVGCAIKSQQGWHSLPSVASCLSTYPRHTDDDADFEARLAALKQAKGETPAGEGKKVSRKMAAAPASRKSPACDFSDETLVFESGPATGDTAVNLALGVTLVWLPLTIAALGRAAFVKVRSMASLL